MAQLPSNDDQDLTEASWRAESFKTCLGAESALRLPFFKCALPQRPSDRPFESDCLATLCKSSGVNTAVLLPWIPVRTTATLDPKANR